jgi:CheY-like chemotaxis protein
MKTLATNKKILIADDDLRNRKLMETLLRIDGYLVFTTQSGKELLGAVADDKPDLILLDLMMPGMDGFEVVRRLKADEKTRDIPIVMVTALDDAGSGLRLRAAGVADVLPKPLDRWQLKKVLDQLLGEGT